MSAANQCESLFNNVDDLGAGIAAIGDLMQHVGEDAADGTAYGIGFILRRFGLEMRGLNNQFLDKTYKDIREMEIKEAQAAELARQEAERAARPALDPADEMRRNSLMAQIKQILKYAEVANKEEAAPAKEEAAPATEGQRAFALASDR